MILTWKLTDVETTDGHIDVTASCACGTKYAKARVTPTEGHAAAHAAITRGLAKTGHADCTATDNAAASARTTQAHYAHARD